MEMTITEGQKRMLTIMFAVVVVVFVFILGISPTNKKITEVQTKEVSVEKDRNEMQKVVDNAVLEIELDELIKGSHSEFQRLFAPNEQGKFLLERLLQIDSDWFKWYTNEEYDPISVDDYIKNIAQPRTIEEAINAQNIAEAGQKTTSPDGTIADLKLFLKNTSTITVQGYVVNGINIFDFINNIPPIGKGSADPTLYCWLIKKVAFDVENGEIFMEGKDGLFVSIDYYGMAPPPTEKPESPVDSGVGA